ncbi:protein mab-21-like 3 isoform X3 [Xenopus laevis]|nr:protein mab-21-like 3 isoform X3 [Xenopus laevis]
MGLIYLQGGDTVVFGSSGSSGKMKGVKAEDVHHFLLNTEDLRHRRVSRMVEEVQKILLQVTSDISNRDSRFHCISNAGIHSDSLKVLSPSQFLVTVPLRGLSGFRQKKTRRWRYYSPSGTQLLAPAMEPEKLHQWLEIEQFQKSTPHWHDNDVNIKGDLVPARIIHVFLEHLYRAITFCSLSDKVNVLESYGPSIRLNVETSEQMVEVELVPVVEVPGYWPKKSQWPRFFKRWPLRERVQCVKSFGFDLLARSNYHWQLSFLRGERLLLEAMDDDGGCRMKCYRAVRQMKEDVWCPGNHPVINSQHLQMIFLWASERHPSAKAWKDLGRCFLRIVRRLQKCARQRFLRHYFVRRANLLKYADTAQLDALADKLSRFLQNPSLGQGASSVC